MYLPKICLAVVYPIGTFPHQYAHPAMLATIAGSVQKYDRQNVDVVSLEDGLKFKDNYQHIGLLGHGLEGSVEALKLRGCPQNFGQCF